MTYFSPLRYPGGKRRLADPIVTLLEENQLSDIDYVEPYAGGAAVALQLLMTERANRIFINDLNPGVFAFWNQVLTNADELIQRIQDTEVTIETWKLQKIIYESPAGKSELDLGFATFFLNRTNRSGIINGGPIGGKNQDGEWKLDARFNKKNLILRIKAVANFRSRIHLHNLDAMDFLEVVKPQIGHQSLIFLDPPYIVKGETLYLNEYDLDGHKEVAKTVSKLKTPWIVTYDSAAALNKLYPKTTEILYGLTYAAQTKYEGKEVLYLSDQLRIPPSWIDEPPLIKISRAGSKVNLVGFLAKAFGKNLGLDQGLHETAL